MHSAGLELTKLTYTRLEDNLIRHRGDRFYIQDSSVRSTRPPSSSSTSSVRAEVSFLNELCVATKHKTETLPANTATIYGIICST